MLRFRYFAAFAVLLLLSAFPIACNNDDRREPTPASVDAAPVAQNNDVDTSIAPGSDAEPAQDGRRGATSPPLRTNQIRTRHLFDGAVTAGKVAYKAVTVSVAMGAATGSSSADTDLAGGVLLSCAGSSNQDQFIDNAVLNANGSITITLAANGTAANQFRCVALKPNAKGIT